MDDEQNQLKISFNPLAIGAIIGIVFGIISFQFFKLSDSFSLLFHTIIFLVLGIFLGYLFQERKHFITSLIVGGLFGALIGLIASQYFPLYGGIMTLGQPFSRTRMTLMSGHVFLFLTLGIGAGLLYNSIKNKSKP